MKNIVPCNILVPCVKKKTKFMIFKIQHKIGSSVKNFNVLKVLRSGGMLLVGHTCLECGILYQKTVHIYCNPCLVHLNSNIVMHTCTLVCTHACVFYSHCCYSLQSDTGKQNWCSFFYDMQLLWYVRKSLARLGRKQATVTEDFEFHISHL